jgi:hypothetical protein
MIGWQKPMLARESRLLFESAATHDGAQGHGSVMMGGHNSMGRAKNA